MGRVRPRAEEGRVWRNLGAPIGWSSWAQIVPCCRYRAQRPLRLFRGETIEKPGATRKSGPTIKSKHSESLLPSNSEASERQSLNLEIGEWASDGPNDRKSRLWSVYTKARAACPYSTKLLTWSEAMGEAPISWSTFATTDVGSSSPSESAAMKVSCSQLCDDVSMLPAVDAGRWGTRSTDDGLCKERYENEQPSSESYSARSYAQSPASQKPDVIQCQQTRGARVPPDATGGFTTGFQTSNDSSIAGGGARLSRSDYPLLKSLLMWGHSSGDKTAEQTAAGQSEVAVCRAAPCLWQNQGDLSRQTLERNGANVAAPALRSPNANYYARRRLNLQHLTDIRKMARIFRRAMRLPPSYRQQLPAPSLLRADRIDSLKRLVVHARNNALCLLRFACQLPQLRRKPPHVQVALLKAGSAGCMVLHLAQSYNCERRCWLDSHGTEFRPQDLARLVPSATRPELWDDVAAVGVFLKSLVCSRSESVDGDSDDLMVRFFSLLNAVLIMSPENVPCVRESDCDIAADVSDYQQSCILLLRRHLESSLSIARAAKLLPVLLTHLVAIRSLAMDVRIALLSERMVRRDSVLGDALSLELAMCLGRSLQ